MKTTSRKPMIVMLLLVSLVFGAIYGFQQFRNHMIQKAIRGQGMPPQAVSTTIARKEIWSPGIEAMGSLHAVLGTNLSTETGGLITAIHFQSGDTVAAGKLLIELNAEPLKAQLGALQATEKLAQINYNRDLEQFKIQAISQAVLDTDVANLHSAQAQVASQQALIAQKVIRAPFAGKLGIRQVDPGQYLTPGASIVSLQKLDPIYLDFSVPQTQLSLIHPGENIHAQTDALPDKLMSGSIMAIEPQIDSSTRNIAVRAELPNTGGKLLPGLFMTVHINQGSPQNLITLPNAAIAYNPYGSTVFVVRNQGKNTDGTPKLVVEQHFVTTGATRGDQVSVLNGLQVGDVVVTSGQLKLHNGAPVFINNSIMPTDNPNPKVRDE
uniref:Putative Secretion protein HlyD n=1 Tax=mine drainage metagenome TaxID=410659 RepID=E6QU26_9ZZZZ